MTTVAMIRSFMFLNCFVFLCIIILIWWSEQQEASYINAADTDGTNVNHVEIKLEPTGQLRIHNAHNVGGRSNHKLVSDTRKEINIKDDIIFSESTNFSLRRSGVNSRCEDYPISSSNMTIPSDKQLLIVFLFPEAALYPRFSDMSECAELRSECKLVFVTTKVTEAVGKYIFTEADFVIFHLNGPQPNTAFTDYLRSLHYPGVRNPIQRWVLFNQQAPVYSAASTEHLASLEGWFNFTMSYSHLADIIFPYGECYRKQENRTVILRRHLLSMRRQKINHHFEKQNETSINEYLKMNIYDKFRQEIIKQNFVPYTRSDNRTAFVMWTSSHCITANKRELYVYEMAKYIGVDVYGDCGTKKMSPKCQNNNVETTLENCVRKEKDKYEEKYKFYLSFENSYCEDYVTEKIFKMLVLPGNIVPVVLGSGPYSAYLPPNSYINVNDFDNPKELTDFLMFLNENTSEYEKYLTWIHDYECTVSTTNSCTLCKALLKLTNRKNVVSENLYEVFGDKNCFEK